MSLPLSLYVHIPWCERKCPYCDFNSHLAKIRIDEHQYIDALLADFDQDILDFGLNDGQRAIQSVFIGGGTPSLFSPVSLATLLGELAKKIPFSPTVETTLEANPSSSEASKFVAFRDAGINRLSIGIQSFNARHLQRLGRIHNGEQALAAVVAAKDAGFRNLNLDLMFGLPGQNREQALADLDTALSLAPNHVSCYQLTIEPNTAFYAQPPSLPVDDELWEIQTALTQALDAAAYQRYEVSAYAKNGSECRHNLNYWQFGDYLGVGAGAHSKISSQSEHGAANLQVTRRWKLKQPAHYLRSKNKVGASHNVTGEQLVFEFLLNALRLKNGFTIETFTRHTGQNPAWLMDKLSAHRELGLLTIEPQKIVTTEFGFERLNNILEDFVT